MKKIMFLFLAAGWMISNNASAQTTVVPAGFSEATVTLRNGTQLKGYAENLISARRVIAFRENSEAKKQNFSPKQLQSAQIGNQFFQIIQGDFFQLHTLGNSWELCEKISNSPASIEYNGVEPIMVSGSPGGIGDVFLFNRETNQLLSVQDAFAKKYLQEKSMASNHSLPAHIVKTLQVQ
ncbi:MAG: hypothetical protein FGM61_03365 [Sediminibacterium sp.]|nr:hypothetical protein [Sediminibacterium sp.]